MCGEEILKVIVAQWFSEAHFLAINISLARNEVSEALRRSLGKHDISTYLSFLTLQPPWDVVS